MVTVYFNPDHLSIYFSERAPDRDKLQRVCTVNVNTLEEAWRIVQHVEEDWNEDPRVQLDPAYAGPLRSLSVGDVLELDGKMSLVAPMGYEDYKPETPGHPIFTFNPSNFNGLSANR